MTDIDALQEANLHWCSLCNQMFYSGNPNILLGQFAIEHIVCQRCILCIDCGDEFDSLIAVVVAPSGNYCTGCAGDLLAELQIEKKE